MANDDPVTRWIGQLADADEEAATRVWNHFIGQLYEYARGKINGKTRRVYDEEDAAQSAFHSVCAGIAKGRFPDLHDRVSLWRLLLVITSRKLAHRYEYDHRQRRDVRRVIDEGSWDAAVDSLPSTDPTPEFAAECTEVCEALFAALADPQLREIARLRMEGFTEVEIAQQVRCSRRTVQRRIEMIRRSWQGMEK